MVVGETHHFRNPPYIYVHEWLIVMVNQVQVMIFKIRTVDGNQKSGENQLRLVVYQLIYRALYIPNFVHQQYLLLTLDRQFIVQTNCYGLSQSHEDSLLRTKICPSKALLKVVFLFPILVFWRVAAAGCFFHAIKRSMQLLGKDNRTTLHSFMRLGKPLPR